jgi:ribosomal protein S18 acetylase RimI-like enzyme
MQFNIENSENSEIWYSIHETGIIPPIAVAKLSENPDYVKIEVINVQRDYRSKGFGTALLNRIVKINSEKKIMVKTFVYLLDWYKKFGFKIISQNGNLYILERIPLH